MGLGAANQRGGAFNNEARALRAAYRNRNQPDNRNDNIGFRCVRDVERGCVFSAVDRAGTVTAFPGEPFHFRAARRTQRLRAAASNIKQAVRPCGSECEAGPGRRG